jgi:hypothetical protein
MNITRFTKKNKYGGYTWEIKLNEEFIIELNSSDINSFVVNFKEVKWIFPKTHFSIVVNENIEDTIKIACDKMMRHMQKLSRYSQINEFTIKKITTEILQELKNTTDPVEKLYLNSSNDNPKIEGIYPINGFSTITYNNIRETIEEESSIKPMNGFIRISSTEIIINENDIESTYRIVSGPKYSKDTNVYNQNYLIIEIITEYKGVNISFRFNYLSNSIAEKVCIYQTETSQENSTILIFNLGIL